MSVSESSPAFWQSLEILDNQHWVSASFNGSGHFEFLGSLRFAGKWRGTISSTSPDAHLFVRAGANVMGRLKVARLSVEGELQDVDVEVDEFHALPGSRIFGKVKAKKVIIDEGAIIEGRVVSAQPSPAAKSAR